MKRYRSKMKERQKKYVGYVDCIQIASQVSDGLQTTRKMRTKPSLQRWKYQFIENWDQNSQ
jgi:hypothetical protein